ncbi:SoxR reducing system RseC family protein [Vibrio cincinnatiensis]|jgi:sigma-E factor negative regulatory protein RseC|uniref:Positive regulator of sigma(E), RseC/MucC n=1 Tax=Vibrio cincinnatiensis DSM 19608 TaxID=1123491 RepID=A0A1T4P907_VIBCI|nr:SoxR reducing system RseC family protein [Vibrio cincinnatiensis]MCG3723391.1 transcriptional regulator [Vibrio cincinnatiensis]SJZ87939.1 positive regulator of sigma(E), RseC/MucC [Vibrio cincinnatiensis DSM 19608]SUP47665.1 sigma-E factor regulatory protein RseC [Vibrio cincinnatiensis]
MMTALATVSAVEPHSTGYWIDVSCEQQTSCRGCQSEKNCGTGIVSKAIGSKALTWRLNSEKPVSAGQVVEIGFPEKSLLQSAALVYLLPLLMMIAGAAIADIWLSPLLSLGEGVVIGCALLSMAFGVMLAKYYSIRLSKRSIQEVILLRVLGDPIL